MATNVIALQPAKSYKTISALPHQAREFDVWADGLPAVAVPLGSYSCCVVDKG